MVLKDIKNTRKTCNKIPKNLQLFLTPFCSFSTFLFYHVFNILRLSRTMVWLRGNHHFYTGHLHFHFQVEYLNYFFPEYISYKWSRIITRELLIICWIKCLSPAAQTSNKWVFFGAMPLLSVARGTLVSGQR